MIKRIFMVAGWLACVCLFGSCYIGVSVDNQNIGRDGACTVSATYPDAERYLTGGGSSSAVRDLDVEWIAGELRVVCDDGQDIRWEEYQESELPDEWKMRYYLEDSVLHIRFCQEGKVRIKNVTKKLTLRIPKSVRLDDVRITASSSDVRLSEGLFCNNLTINGVSGDMSLAGVHGKSATVSTTSGDLSLSRVNVHTLDVKSVSGDVSVREGQCGSVSAETSSGDLHLLSTLAENYTLNSVSGDISLEKSGFFDRMTVNNVSGDVRLLLSDRAGFTLRTATVSGSFRSREALLYQDGVYSHGDGAADVDVHTVSGDISLQFFSSSAQ